MKPVPQISSKRSERRNFPLTDYHFQSTHEASGAAVKETHPVRELRTFWKLSAEFLGTEASRDYLTELLFFSIITGLSAWPVISMIVAVTRMVRNY